MSLLKGAAVMTVAMLASPVLADAVLPIGDAYGNEAGCNLYMSGSVGSDENLGVLTPHTLTTFTSGCTFKSSIRDGDGRHVVQASCSLRGAQQSATEEIHVVDRGRDGLFVAAPSLGNWGPLPACPGTAQLFTLGTHV